MDGDHQASAERQDIEKEFMDFKDPFFDARNIAPQEKEALIICIEQMQTALDRARAVLVAVRRGGASPPPAEISVSNTAAGQQPDQSVIIGIFDGQHMVGNNGKTYLVPPNYASKSKLVDGDELKLSITSQGAFIYKQLHPVNRERLVGILEYDQEIRGYRVVYEGKKWKVLTASITYYKGVAGDKVVILVPQNRASAWAAVEHIMKNQQ